MLPAHVSQFCIAAGEAIHPVVAVQPASKACVRLKVMQRLRTAESYRRRMRSRADKPFSHPMEASAPNASHTGRPWLQRFVFLRCVDGGFAAAAAGRQRDEQDFCRMRR
ncbi:unnamed protein product [Symbiodinium sp. CCMP2456]|nr:unnamed protein product [Symbiodinium sp. CCMP2456]